MSAVLFLGAAAAGVFAISKMSGGVGDEDSRMPRDSGSHSHASDETTVDVNADPRAQGAAAGEGGSFDALPVDGGGLAGTEGTSPQPTPWMPPNRVAVGPAPSTAPQPQVSVRYRTISINQLAYGENAVMGTAATAKAVAEQGPAIGGLW